MASRDERRLHNNKAEQIVVKRGHPTRAEAFEGNITLRYIENKGLFLYSYFKSRWYRTELTLDNPTGKKLEKSMVVKSINIIDEIDLKKTRVKGLVADEIEDGLLKAIPTKTKSGLKINDNFKIDGDTNPKLSLGLNDRESLQINTTYDTSENLSEINITTITSASSPNLVLDIAGDIELNADGGQVIIKDDTATHFLFDCNATRMRIYDDTNESDLFEILVAANGATTLSTNDSDGAVGHLTLQADGNIDLDSHEIVILDGRDTAAAGRHIEFRANGTRFGQLTGLSGGGSDLMLFERGGDSTDDWFRVRVTEHGESSIQTYDTAGANAHLNLISDGNATIDCAAEIVLDHTDRFKFKKAGTEYVKFDVDGSSQFTMFEQGGTTTDDYFKIDVATHGATTFQTVDAASGLGLGTAADLTFNIDGDIHFKGAATSPGAPKHNFNGKIDSTDYQWARLTGNATSSSFTFFNPADTGDYFKIHTAAHGATTISTLDNAIGGNNGDVTIDAMGDITLDAATGNIYVKDNGGNYTPGSDYEIATKKYVDDNAGGGGGTSRWSNTAGGYKTNNNSSTNYYFPYYPDYHVWANSDSSPTTLSYTDSYAYNFCAPADGALTNITVTCRASDTGATDPLKFYVFKGVPSNEATTVSLTQIGVTGTITPVSAKQMHLSTDISSSNTFSAGDKLWVMLKKDSTSGNQDLYFAVTISGTYS